MTWRKRWENHPIRIKIICWELLDHFLKSFVQEIEAMASDCGMDIPGGVPMMKVETLMFLTRYAAYSGKTFMHPFKVSRKVILHFAQ